MSGLNASVRKPAALPLLAANAEVSGRSIPHGH